MQSYYQFRLRHLVRRYRRSLRLLRRHLGQLGGAYVFKRTKRLRRVQRFLVGTVGLFVLALGGLIWQFGQLRDSYLVEQGRSGGTFIEGTLGPLTRINPLFPDEPAAELVSKLVFSGLMRYNSQGKLVGDLARSLKHNKLGTIYTTTLRNNLFWHDGKRLTSSDVAFTINTIKNPDAHSPLAPSWRGIQVKVVNKRTLRFELPGPFAPFPNALTQAIVPRHLLAGIDVSQLRLADFNQHPVGSGPFVFEEFVPAQKTVRLRANPTYSYGPPQLRRFIVRTFETQESLLAAFDDHQITAASGFGVFDATAFAKVQHTRLHEWPTASQAFVFFNTARSRLNNRSVRQALVRSARASAVAEQFDYRFSAASAPLLPQQLGYSRQLRQFGFDVKLANKQLNRAGWKFGSDGWRYKKKQRLILRLVTQNRDIYPLLAQTLQEQWQKVGVDLRVRLATSTDLQDKYIKPRNYDILLFGIVLGADPDVFSYWHSSQVKDPGLNLALYRSDIADVDLETGRTRLETKFRAGKYRDFMRQWRDDAPAMAVYRASFLYAVQDRVHGIRFMNLISPTDRFYNVKDWTVNTKLTLKRLAN